MTIRLCRGFTYRKIPLFPKARGPLPKGAYAREVKRRRAEELEIAEQHRRERASERSDGLPPLF